MCSGSGGGHQETSTGLHMALLATPSGLCTVTKVKGRIIYWKYFCLINTISIQQSRCLPKAETESIKRRLLFIPLLIVFPASRIHRSVEWPLLLSLGHWVSAVDLQCCCCCNAASCMLAWIHSNLMSLTCKEHRRWCSVCLVIQRSGTVLPSVWLQGQIVEL